MTTGQRISAKRRELELSQEGLGERLGVSRQSIYKWESDASLPEIDKLVAMSRLFSVSVGWLLGVEDTPEAPTAEELSEGQLHMIEEVFARYQQAPQSQSKLFRGKWGRRLLALGCALVVVSFLAMNDKINRLNHQYSNSINNLSNSINNISSNVNRQVDSITNRVEEALKAQDSLIADSSVMLVDTDVPANTATFALRVVPKTYTAGLELVFLADCGDGPLEFPGILGVGQEFTAQVTCPLTDSIALSVVFVEGDTRQTQLLDKYSALYLGTLPHVELMDFSHFLRQKAERDGRFRLEDNYVAQVYHSVRADAPASDQNYPIPAAVKSLKVGLFLNRELVQWLEPCPQPDSIKGGEFKDGDFYALPPIDLSLSEGDELCFAGLVTDEFGRQMVRRCYPSYTVEDDVIVWRDGDYEDDLDPSQWVF